LFGYIKPVTPELKVREHEFFKACYCGLCHALKRNYGIASRFILNYEFVFLSMLLWETDVPVKKKRKRCIASPIKKKCFCYNAPPLDTCAGYSVILAWWKLRDSIKDERFVKSIPYRMGRTALKRAYKKASRDFPDFDGVVKTEISSLSVYEQNEETSLDRAADAFSHILAAVATDEMPGERRRPLLELLYHLGRWIYIIDACDDIKDDVAAKRYNPVASRFAASGGKLDEADIERLKTTLDHSNNLIGSAFELLPEGHWSEIIRNVIYLGMPEICKNVLKTFEADRCE